MESGGRWENDRAFPAFFGRSGQTEKGRGESQPPAPGKFFDLPDGADQGAIGFIVGIKPMWGAPLAGWAVAILMVFSPVVPQQPSTGQ